MFPKNIPSYMVHYFQQKQPAPAPIPDVKPLTKQEEKKMKFESASNKIKLSEDQTKKPPTEKELSIDDYIELLKEEGNRKYYLELLNSLIE